MLIKDYWQQIVAIVMLIGVFITVKNESSAHARQLTDHTVHLAQLDRDAQVDDLSQQRLADKVDTIDEKVDQLEDKQDEMLREQAAQSKIQIQQNVTLEQILREIRKTNAGP